MTITQFPNFIQQVGQGLISGAGKGIYQNSIHKFGQNPDIDSGSVPEAIWPVGGQITWPSSAATASISSDSANDAAAGTGIQTLFVQGVDASFVRISETITLNGTTPVSTVNSYLFIDRMFGVLSGSNERNVGNITATIGGNTVAYIGAGDGQTLQAAMVLPDYSGTKPHALQIWAGMGKAQSAYVRLQLLGQRDGETRRVGDDVVVSSEGGLFNLIFETPIAGDPGTRFWWECIESSTNNVEVFAGFEIAWI